MISNLEYVLNCDNVIEEIYISEILITENELTNMFPRINVDSMISSGLYTGRNVNVGIVESGAVPRISSFTSDYSGRNITIKSGSSGVNDHADHVTMIAVGNNGIARGSNIFLSNSTGGAEEYLNWMIENNVNIVNTSFGYKDEAASGTYTSEAKRIDQMIRNSFITMVGSAGNSNTSPTLRVTGPKTAYNYITVGNSGTTTTTRVAGSCYVEQSGYGASKPNLMAPGTVTTNAYGGVSKSGTSFASPQVAGCLALLMEEFPFLIAYPELCLSVVTSSASPMSSTYNTFSGDNYYDQSGLHNQIGSGLLNYEKMREAMNNYVSITRARNSAIEDLDDNGETLEFTASKNQRVRASLAWLANGTDENNFTDYDLYLQRKQTDGSYITLMFINGTENNVEFLDYTFGNDGTYRLLIKQREVNVKKDLLAMSYVIIDGSVGGSKSGGNVSHICNNYIDTGSSSEYHIDKCDCGYNSYELHNRYIDGDHIKCTDCDWIKEIVNDSILSTSYGFTEEYNFNILTGEVSTTSGDIVDIERLRCGYISDSYLTMSAKRNNAGTAYLQYNFDYGIHSITYDLGLWSDNESLKLNSSIRLEALNSEGEWIIIRMFDPYNMSVDKDNLLTYTDVIPFLTYSYRFIVETNMVQNENNRGRVVIGDIDIVGYETAQHVHSFTNWVYNDHMTHIEKCDCGLIGTTTRPHVISASESGNRYATCLECNHLLDLTTDMGIVQMSSNTPILITTNGSYILPNGIVVLVDDDLDAYFLGTLIFYEQNEIPTIE